MNNPLAGEIRYLLDEAEKYLRETEYWVFKLRQNLFHWQNFLKMFDNDYIRQYGIDVDSSLIIDQFEAEYKDGVLKILIFDVPPVYKVNTQEDTFKWKDLVTNAINSLSEKPKFEKAHIHFEFYVPVGPFLKADTDNRMVKTIINQLVTCGVIPNDTMSRVKITLEGHTSTNVFPKTVIKVTSYTPQTDPDIASRTPPNYQEKSNRKRIK
ncbi:hypothetical protein Csac_2656 [Caldicellulosiruptor saccharolyticus DSM 8903]|uniref:Uncharacterized protein n=1 Tax=Caldicellulosiruptor saccharolyticus (strain ATCC 43494 / DSM 8903 / Tp8T 6331) TaxID=351627 RepID=A4XMU2_CALS8|nr:hypothetical protein [Caldicellulosiruptor saccharolyticus]ABP68227.1 hypothetical protein Csac_2656 [Caldicellulosiruptor saccharolyticus DSM 8903]